MAVDEQARHRLHQKLEQVLGAEEAGILMEHLPPRGFGDLATKGDLELSRAATKADIDVLRVATKADIDGLRAELHGLLVANDAEHESMRAATKSGFDLLRAEQEALRHELLGAIHRSTRQMMAWVSGMVLATGGLAFTAGRFV
jgi:hypothetical protein